MALLTMRAKSAIGLGACPARRNGRAEEEAGLTRGRASGVNAALIAAMGDMGVSRIDQDRPRAVRWNLLQAALFGCIAGGVVSIVPKLLNGEVYHWAYGAGLFVGGAIGGAVLFGLVAGLRNLVLRAR